MASNSDRRSGSSGPSKKRKSVYLGSTSRDRHLHRMRTMGRGTGDGREPLSERRGVAAEAAHARREERESRHASQKRTLRNRTLLIAGAVLLVLVSCVALVNSPLFPVGRVEILGTRRLTTDRVLALAAVPRDATLLRLPADEVAERVGTDPWVESVTVSRVFPDGMRIRVVERTPAAMVDAGKVFWLVDREGMIIAQPSTAETATLVAVRDVSGLDPSPGRKSTSEPLLNALKVLEGITPQLASEVRVVSAPTVDGTTLYTADKVEIVFGSATEMRQKDALVRKILKDQRGKVVSIDVRTTARPTWRGLTR